MPSRQTTALPSKPFGSTGLPVSSLSIGAMRLPKEMSKAVTLLRAAIDAGCNYIDTSFGYGDSELKLAQALKDGYRERVMLSTKCSPWIHKEDGYTTSASDTLRKMEESMKRLEVDYLDFYQVWNVTDADTLRQATAPGQMVDGIHEAMKEGLVRHIAATAHAPDEVVTDMIDGGLFETITISYNLLNRGREAVMAHAFEKGVGIVAMNPIAGGLLGCHSPALDGILPDFPLSTTQLSLKFVIEHPHISCAISGFSKMSDVEENVEAALAPPLTGEDRKALVDGLVRIQQESKEFCTQCGYCMPCEQGVEIRRIFDMVNKYLILGLEDWARAAYANLRPEQRADACTGCGACTPKCTNKLDIPAELRAAHALLRPAE